VTADKSKSFSVLTGRGPEVAIRIGLLVLLAAACLLVVQPFLTVIGWSIIMTMALHPTYDHLAKLLGHHRNTAATLVTLILLGALIAPVLALSETLVSGAQSLAKALQNGTLAIPPPPESVQHWPLIGERLAAVWSAAVTNLTATLAPYRNNLADIGRWLLGNVAGLGLGIAQFIAAVIVTGVLLARGEAHGVLGRRIGLRIAGANGERFIALVVATTRSVARGVLGVALIQAVLAGIGLLVVGVPGAGLWAMVALLTCIVQIGPAPVVIPAAIYVSFTADTTTTVLFAIWCLFVMLIDNFLKPILLGRGVDVPLIVVVLGAIGGLLTMGIIGLFIGAIVLVLGYTVLLIWLDGSATEQSDSR
jgi:predicted PurR-regulated permease PerM